MLLKVWFKLLTQKFFLLVDWLRCQNKRFKRVRDIEDTIEYYSWNYFFRLILYQLNRVLRKLSLAVVDDQYDFIFTIRKLCDCIYFYTKRRGMFTVLNSISAQFIFLGQIIEFSSSRRIFLDRWGGGHVGYISFVFSPVFLHHVFLYSWSFRYFVWRFNCYLEQRFDLFWQLSGTNYDDIVVVDVSSLFSTKSIFLKFLKQLCKSTPNEGRVIINPYLIPGLTFKDSKLAQNRVLCPTIEELITFFHPVRTFINTDFMHPDSFSNLKIWYFPWTAMFFSVDDEILQKRFLPYLSGVTDSIQMNKEIIAEYFTKSVADRLWWTRQFNIFRRTPEQIILRSYKLNGFFMWHIIWYPTKWLILKQNFSFSVEV